MNRDKITNIQFGGVDFSDCPDFTDAFIQSADYNGEPMTEKQLDEINEDAEFINEQVLSQF